MAYARRQRANQDIWPGFVDALASLLMVIIFLLMIFVVSQFYLNEEIIGRDKALDRLQNRVSELADMLALERESSAAIRTNLTNVTEQLRASLQRQDALESQIFQLRGENASLASELDAAQSDNRELLSRLTLREQETQSASEQIKALTAEREQVSAELEDAYKVIDADKETIEAQLIELAKLERELQALIALRDDMEGRLAEETLALDESQKDLIATRAEAALLNDQLEALNAQIAELNSLLETYEARDAAQQSQIVDLGKRLNVALAGKVKSPVGKREPARLGGRPVPPTTYAECAGNPLKEAHVHLACEHVTVACAPERDPEARDGKNDLW